MLYKCCYLLVCSKLWSCQALVYITWQTTVGVLLEVLYNSRYVVCVCACVCVCVRKFHINWLCVSWIWPMNWRHSYQKALSPFCKLQIWACWGMIRVDTKFEQGLEQVKKCLRVYGMSVTFMSTAYMYHEYDLCTGDWIMVLVSTSDVTI